MALRLYGRQGTTQFAAYVLPAGRLYVSNDRKDVGCELGRALAPFVGRCGAALHSNLFAEFGNEALCLCPAAKCISGIAFLCFAGRTLKAV